MTRTQVLRRLGRNVKRLREERGLSLSELARKIDNYAASIKRIEDGDNMPQVDLLLDLSTALGVTPNDLLGIEAPAEV